MTNDFAKLLKDLRAQSGLSLRDLARVANCSKSEVGHAETGFRVPSDQVVSGLDRALSADGVLLELARSVRQRRHHLRAPMQRQGEIVLRLKVAGQDLVLSFDRRSMLQGGATLLVGAFGLTTSPDELVAGNCASALRSPLSLTDVLASMRDQWHELVKADNVLGPGAATPRVHHQLTIVQSLLDFARGEQRRAIIQLGALYAESMAWLQEDLSDLPSARHWVHRAAEWAFEADDRNMLAWTMLRRSQHARVEGDAGQALGLARAVRRDDTTLPTPMRAALRVQEAFGHALDADATAAHRVLDQAHAWAASDHIGDARSGHGSFCTPGYIEVSRADCLLLLGRPADAIELYEQSIPSIPEAYVRDRAAASSRLAAAYAACGRVVQAANTILAVAPVAQATRSRRTVQEVERVAATLAPHSHLPPVAEMLEAVDAEG